MGKKLVALMVMCIVVVAAMNVYEAEANAENTFKVCFVACHKDCQGNGNGFTFCEVKCDDECSEKEAEAKLSGVN